MRTIDIIVITITGIAISSSIYVFVEQPFATVHTTLTSPGDVFTSISINPVTHKVYTTNFGTNSVWVMDTSRNQTLAIIPIDGNPWDVAVNPATNKVYVVNGNSDNSVTVIDGATDSVIKNIKITEMGAQPPKMSYDALRIHPEYYKIEPMQVAVNPVTDRVYVSDWNYPDGGVTVIDGSSDSVVDRILNLGGASYGIGVNPNTNRIYVDSFQTTRYAPNLVSVIDGRTDRIVANVTVGVGVGGISTIPNGLRIIPLAVNSETDMIYAQFRPSATMVGDPLSSHTHASIAVINGTSNKVVYNIPFYAESISTSSGINMVYATVEIWPGAASWCHTDSLIEVVAVINGSDNQETNCIKTDGVAFAVASNPNGGIVYVTTNWPHSSFTTFNFER